MYVCTYTQALRYSRLMRLMNFLTFTRPEKSTLILKEAVRFTFKSSSEFLLRISFGWLLFGAFDFSDTNVYFKDTHDCSQRTSPLCGYYSCFVFCTSEFQISARSPAVMTVGLLSCYQLYLYHRTTLHFLLHVVLHYIFLLHTSIITVILRDVKRVLRGANI
jgi:hypothetical protein